MLTSIVMLLLSPFNWILVLTVATFIIKKKSLRKKLLISAFIILMIFGNRALQQFVFLSWQPEPVTLKPDQKYSACIVLGGMSAYDMHGRGYFKSAADRFIQAVQLYHSGHVKKVIISGGVQYKSSVSKPEGNFIMESLLKSGIPQQDILIESQSTNTFENADFTKKLLDSAGLKPPYLMVTSALHIKRAKAAFEKAGLHIIPFPCNYLVIENKISFFDYFIPDFSLLDNWNHFNKEIVGLWVYRIRNRA